MSACTRTSVALITFLFAHVTASASLLDETIQITGCFPDLSSCEIPASRVVTADDSDIYFYGVASLNVNDVQLVLTSNGGLTLAMFNGFVISGLDLDNLPPGSVINGLSVSSNSFPTFSAADISFTGNSITLNLGGDNNAGQAVIDISTSSPPVATLDPGSALVPGEDHVLDGSASFDPDVPGGIVAYEWDVDNDGTYDALTSEPTYTIAASSLADVFDLSLGADNTVALRVTDTSGLTGSVTASRSNQNVSESTCFQSVPSSCSYSHVTDLEFLDLAFTLGRSYADVYSQLDFGGEFAGFRFASYDEVLSLLVDAAIPVIPGNDPSNIGPISGLIDLTGATVTAGAFRSASGSSGTPSGPLAPGTRRFIDIGHDNASFGSVISGGSFDEDATDPNRAHWLVKTDLVDSDDDGDGVLDYLDNCSEVPNVFSSNPLIQRDTDNDGYGNACDPDLNNDGIVNAQDLGLFKNVFFSPDDDADFNGDGIVNAVDLGVLKTFFFLPPGPSGLLFPI